MKPEADRHPLPAFARRRDIVERLVIEGELELTSPAHLGCGRDDEESDQPLVADQDGKPYLPGTTIAGLLRHQLSPCEARVLLGPESQDDVEAEQSRLLFSDSQATFLPSRELREGVAICPQSGVAKDKTKYDFELLSIGSRFALRFELLLPESSADADRLKELTGKLLVRLEQGRVRLGARSQRGFGECRVSKVKGGSSWRVTRFSTTDLNGLLAWMGIDNAPVEYLDSGCVWMPGEDEATSDFEVTLKLRVLGGILIGSGGHGADEADKSHLHRRIGGESSEPVLAGTSLAGVLRHRCDLIARTLGLSDSLVTGLFGSMSCASKVRVSEVPIRGGQTLRHSRVRIDPWLGGAAETALFTQDVHYAGELDLRATVRGSTPAERAILLLALRDLSEGHVRVGGQTGAGRGRLAPANEGEFGEIRSPHFPHTIKLVSYSGRVRIEPEDALEAEFQALEGCA